MPLVTRARCAAAANAGTAAANGADARLSVWCTLLQPLEALLQLPMVQLPMHMVHAAAANAGNAAVANGATPGLGIWRALLQPAKALLQLPTVQPPAC